jgi:hypothetical protein
MIRDSRGQSLVELVAIAPVVILCGLIGLQALVAGATFVYADNAAHAGALAGQLDTDPVAAASAAAPGWASGRVFVEKRGRVINVKLTPRAIVPPLAGLLAAHASARIVTSLVWRGADERG